MVDTKGLKNIVMRRDGVDDGSRPAAEAALDELIDEGDYLSMDELEDTFDIFSISDGHHLLYAETF